MHPTIMYETKKAVLQDRINEAEAANLIVSPRVSRRRRRLVPAVLGVSTVMACLLGFASSSLAAPPPNCAQTADTITCAYASTGSEQTFLVPADVDNIQVNAVGAPAGTAIRPLPAAPARSRGAICR